jgi:hypothetical protein
MGVKVARFFVQRMKTKWGSCNPDRRSIRLNTDLAKKPRECLEYIVVHEMAHLLVRRHDDRFRGLMDRHLPNWEYLRETLNNSPLAHSDWVEAPAPWSFGAPFLSRGAEQVEEVIWTRKSFTENSPIMYRIRSKPPPLALAARPLS